jgi:hypothetical protein
MLNKTESGVDKNGYHQQIGLYKARQSGKEHGRSGGPDD